MWQVPGEVHKHHRYRESLNIDLNLDVQIVKILLSHSKKEVRSMEDSCGSIPLFCAIEAANNNVCKELLSKDPEPQVI